MGISLKDVRISQYWIVKKVVTLKLLNQIHFSKNICEVDKLKHSLPNKEKNIESNKTQYKS